LKQLPAQYKSEAEISKERASDIGTQLKRDEEFRLLFQNSRDNSTQKGEISLTNFVERLVHSYSQEEDY